MTPLRVVLLRLQFFTVALASSYLTLCVVNIDAAQDLCWAYGALTLVVALAMILLERRRP